MALLERTASYHRSFASSGIPRPLPGARTSTLIDIRWRRGGSMGGAFMTPWNLFASITLPFNIMSSLLCSRRAPRERHPRVLLLTRKYHIAPTAAIAMTAAPSSPTPTWPQPRGRPAESAPLHRDRRRPACAGRSSGRRGSHRRRRRGRPRRTATRKRLQKPPPLFIRPSGTRTKKRMQQWRRQRVRARAEGSGGRCAYRRWPCWSWRSGQKTGGSASPGGTRSWSPGGIPRRAPIKLSA